MSQSEAARFIAFTAFVKNQNLTRTLIQRDWSAFARRYNGPNYRANHYASKLSAAYHKYAPPPQPILRRKSRGKAVRILQNLLAIRSDGIFGAETLSAVLTAQTQYQLTPDGIVGPRTWAALRNAQTPT